MPEDIEGRTQYADGASVLFRGEEYKLKIIEDTRVKQPSVVLQSNELVVTMKQYVTQQVDTLVKHWYKEEARVRIEERVKQYHSFVNKEITSIKIKNQKKRWGSCSSLGNLNFNWRIVMMRDEVFDYIIVHELCHLLHMNHSKEYWKSVEQIIPYYKESENWLKQNGYKLFYQ
jgi:predicted metal-dependent hydrolase